MQRRMIRSRQIVSLVFLLILLLLALMLPIQVRGTRTETEIETVQSAESEPTETSDEEQIQYVPLYFQQDYPDTPYGGYGTVSSHGCGITSVAMVFSYLLDEPIMPDTLAEEFGNYNTECGSAWTLFPDSAEKYGLTATRTSEWDEVVEALKDGHIAIANPTKCLFTEGGHYIVLYGITEDEKILVHDPNKYNYFMFNKWCYPALTEGFLNGFDQEYLNSECLPCWIYPLKDLEAVERRKAEKALEDYIADQEKALEDYIASLE